MVVSFGLMDIIDIVIFFILEYLCYIFFYFIQKIDKNINPSIFILCLGINLIALSFLFRVGNEINVNPFVTISILGGAMAILVGGVFVYYRKISQISDLKKRYNEIQNVITNLKEKYYKQEISEDDLKSVHSEMLKELAELEVKMKELEKK
jgi:hypothetical protein